MADDTQYLEIPTKHPAKFSKSVLDVLRPIIAEEVPRLWQERPSMLYPVKEGLFAYANNPPVHGIKVFDPMAGVGGIHELGDIPGVVTYGLELEPEWANQHAMTLVGDATNIPFFSIFGNLGGFDVVCTSPSYGNRMADHHKNKDRKKDADGERTGPLTERITYRHKLGRDLSANSGAGLQWGQAYRELHQKILNEMIRVTKPGGLVIVNISNHIRGKQEQPVAEWWLARMVIGGLVYEQGIQVPTPRMLMGTNREARVECEWVFVTRKREM